MLVEEIWNGISWDVQYTVFGTDADGSIVIIASPELIKDPELSESFNQVHSYTLLKSLSFG